MQVLDFFVLDVIKVSTQQQHFFSDAGILVEPPFETLFFAEVVAWLEGDNLTSSERALVLVLVHLNGTLTSIPAAKLNNFFRRDGFCWPLKNLSLNTD